MKLLFLTEFFPKNKQLIYTGGVEVRTYNIAEKAKKDFQVKVISTPSDKPPATFKSIFFRIFYLFYSVFKALKTEFDVIEGSNFVTYLPAYFAGKIKNKKTIAWIPDILHKDWFQLGLIVGAFGYLIEKISLKLNWDHIIALSHSTKKKLIQSGIKKEKITVVHGGIDLQEFKNLNYSKFPQFTIISIARLVATKRIKDLVKGFALIAKKNPKVKLIIIGHGPKKQSLKEQVEKLNINSKISFYENLPRKQLLKLLKQSHLFCLPSVVEGFGLVTIEAMAVGLPVILTDISISHEITQDKGALFYQPKNSQALADKLEKLISNKKLYQNKSKQALELAKTYSWHKIYQQTKKIYQLLFTNY